MLPLLRRAAPLTSVAQVLSGLFGHADLTVSDLVAALVLTAALQHQPRPLHIQNALAPTAEAMSESQACGDNDMGAPAPARMQKLLAEGGTDAGKRCP